MPLSFLTRLRGVIIVAAFAFALLWLEISNQMFVSAAAFFLVPLLTWLLVSNAVKDAPPFDDTAFHRTRPVTPGRVYRHLIGFHLLLLCCILLVVLAYVWRFNLGGREALIGTISVAIPLIAIGSLFGTVASLGTSPKHWKGWPVVMLLLIPSITPFLLFSLNVQSFQDVPFACLTFAGALIFPALWWLVAVKHQWLLGITWGLLVGIVMPWISIPIVVPDAWLRPEVPERTPALVIQRSKQPTDAEGMVANQAPVSRSLEVRGLEPDEFIQVTDMGTWNASPGYAFAFGHDGALNDMTGANFCTDKNGRLIPASASLFRVMGNEKPNLPSWDNRPAGAPDRTMEDHLQLPVRRYSNTWNKPDAPSFEAQGNKWSIYGNSYRWVKLLDVRAVDGGRAKLPGKGSIRLLPLEVSGGDFCLTLRVTRPSAYPWISETWVDPVTPVIVARDPAGGARFIDLQVSSNQQYGFLTSESGYEFRDQTNQSAGNERLRLLGVSRIEVYWAESRGAFSAILPPPE